MSKKLPAVLTVLAGSCLSLGGDGGGLGAQAAYPVTVDSVIESAKIQASDREAGDEFGFSAAISGDTVVVGAAFEGTGGLETGAAYIFQRDEGGADNWGEVTKLQASDNEEGDLFGWSVAISGDTVIVGAIFEDTGGSLAGATYIFERDQGGANNWGEVVKIQASDKQAFVLFGFSVAISGDTAIVGAVGEDTGGTNAGAAYIFSRNQGGADSWGEVRKVQASDQEEGDEFGNSVAISGDTAVVGAALEDTGGNAYVFQRDQGGTDNWGEVTKLRASDEEESDLFGDSVAISGDVAVIGARGEDTGGLEAGAAYIFVRNQGGTNNWGEITKIQASDKQAFASFGVSVAISGDMVVVGASSEDTGAGNAGAAYVFSRNHGGPDSWGEVTKIQASDRAEGDEFGISVAISADTVIAGADQEDTGGTDAGAAYIFEMALGAEGLIQALIADVEELAVTGVLNNGQANSLTRKLRSALRSLDKGQEIAAANKLMAFINQVEGFVAAGVLTEAEAQPLIDRAIAAIDDILGD